MNHFNTHALDEIWLIGTIVLRGRREEAGAFYYTGVIFRDDSAASRGRNGSGNLNVAAPVWPSKRTKRQPSNSVLCRK